MKEKTYTADETIKLQPGDNMLSSGRIIIEPVSDKGKIKAFISGTFLW